MTRAILPGTFDPITAGHLDVIGRGAQIFDEVVVGVARSAHKEPIFSHDQRVDLARRSVAESGLENVTVEPFDGLLVDFCKRMDARIVVKGLRAITDFEYEFQMTAINYKLSSDIETLFIMSPPEYMYLSSSMVREIASLGGDFVDFVSPCVHEALCERFGIEG